MIEISKFLKLKISQSLIKNTYLNRIFHLMNLFNLKSSKIFTMPSLEMVLSQKGKTKIKGQSNISTDI